MNMTKSTAQVIVFNYGGIQHGNIEEVKEAYKMLNVGDPIFNPNPIPWGLWHRGVRQ